MLIEETHFVGTTRRMASTRLNQDIGDPLELVRYAESECQVWFSGNETRPPTPQDHSSDETQMDNFGNVQLMGTQNYTRRESPLHSSALRSISIETGDGEHDAIFDMSELWNRLQGLDRHA
ncbi:hypothetical protein F2Q69_00023398 [Brassica cretica]|uniref:Uncharacterized protein n=1 Tax=Brassica cretica TaxID=69181 RepID=A0A8S9QQE3_BRACR|nr:hypothetical protein F2Q69_00023398 [Brassica cretica]